MDDITILKIIKDGIDDLNGKDSDSVPKAVLRHYLNLLHSDVSGNSSSSEIEYKSKLLDFELKYKTWELSRNEGFKAALEAGRDALRVLLLINSGAVVAILGFAGSVINKKLASGFGDLLAMSLLVFCFGIIFSVCGFGFRYLTQYYYYYGKVTAGNWLNICSIALAVFSLLLFMAGAIKMYTALTLQLTNMQ